VLPRGRESAERAMRNRMRGRCSTGPIQRPRGRTRSRRTERDA
jgi:hypothetical protein